MAERSKDWFRQASPDIDSARAQLNDGCFPDIDRGIDLFVYTEEEISRSDSPLVKTELHTGIEIYKRFYDS